MGIWKTDPNLRDTKNKGGTRGGGVRAQEGTVLNEKEIKYTQFQGPYGSHFPSTVGVLQI